MIKVPRCPYIMACRPSRGFSALHQAKTVLAPEAFLDEGARRTATRVLQLAQHLQLPPGASGTPLTAGRVDVMSGKSAFHRRS